MDTGLKGRSAIITGGASGIGLGIALALAEEGVNLAIVGRNPDRTAIDELCSKGVKCISIKTDVSKENEVVNMISSAISEFGHIDMYINNAAWAWHQPITKIDSESWYKTIDTNLSACMWACREICRHMIPKKSGSILIIGSAARFNPAYREATYRITKMGLCMYMQNLAIEMAPYNIRVNMITPGHFKTRMTGNVPPAVEDKMKHIIPAHRFGNTFDIGYTAVMLLSDRLSGYTYGADLVIDGGLTLRPLPIYTDEEIIGFNKV
ncbi:MAG: SDR family oxidoreductase [Ruminiclostridium sp.]|nr:SDR family oxidoreductase [Ruminiclostridium sp.]